MACLKRYLPIYYPTAIFFFCGIELLWSAFCMAINQKFWQLSSSIFPIAYRIFNDTLSKGVHENFVWTNAEYYQLELYQYKLALMWSVKQRFAISKLDFLGFFLRSQFFILCSALSHNSVPSKK